MEFREFTRTDWYGYAGATPPRLHLYDAGTGSYFARFEPIIAFAKDTNLAHGAWTIIVDADGISAQLDILDPLDDTFAGMMTPAILFREEAWPANLRTARTLFGNCETISYGDLLAFGFRD